MTSSRPSAFRKYCAAVMAATLALQPLAMYAAPTPITTSPLSETPLEGSNPVKPNIMFTMDESGSMTSSMLPDYVGQVEIGFNGSPPIPAFAPFSWCLGYNGGVGDSVNCSLTSPPLSSSSLNHIYYDPTILYAIGRRPDRSQLPCDIAGNECQDPLVAVYKNGFAGYPGPNPGTIGNGGAINLTTGYPDEVFCSTTTPGALGLATARTDGSVCRYNGVTYGGIGGYRYPNAGFRNRIALTGNPYYYTIASVQFCDTPGLGRWGTGTCGSHWSTTNRYVSYGAGGFDPTAFTRIDIVPTTLVYPSGRNYADEMANFARWYAFSRTRILAMKTAGGIAFSALDENSRVGFNTINTFTANFLNIKEFTTPNKDAWFAKFYSVVPSGSTPSIDAMWRIGQYFSGLDTTLAPSPPLPGATDPLDPDPGQRYTGQCQSNYHLMATDGYANQVLKPYIGLPADPIGDQDGVNVPTLPNLPGATGFIPGQPFPLPYRGTTTDPLAAGNTMADVAMYYWIHDLRPTLPDNVKDSRAPWQHVNFYGLALGAEGTLDYPSGAAAVAAGTTTWPPWVQNTASAIDDLWHAAINGGGKYFNAQNAQQLAESIVSALADFTSQSGTGTAVGLAGAQLTATRSFGYRTSYEAGWWGDVRKYALDPNTGALPVDLNGNPANPPVWSAAPLLDAMAAGAGWDTNRRIVTINDLGAGVPFRFANLSGTQQASLNAGYTLAPIPTAAAVLDFLRGDKSNEGAGSGRFRIRTHVLGDIVSSGAVPVGAPGLPYDDAGNPGYTAFAAANTTRTPTVYVGGNDGMLHAFNDSATADAGKETWAYVPKALFTAGDPNDTTHAQLPKFQIGALSFGGGIPLFEHEFYVNATPRVWDIDFANTNTNTPPLIGNNWHTVLVGGLGAGARAVYALDVTTPVALTDSEASVASSRRVLWEFTDANLGYVFDAPTLVKTKRYGWVVLVASGYNNPGGNGFLYVLNPTTGVILKKMPTGVGTDSEPSGLSTIRAFTASRKDPYVLQAYGGDLKGNVWRFDLSDPNESNWRVELIAHLKDAGGNDQPITTGVRVEIDQNNNVDRYLFVGTGKLLNGKPPQNDLTDASVTSTLYVIRDGTRTAAGAAPATPYSRADLNAVDATQATGFTGPATGRGWYQDAPDPLSKIITDVVADVQTVVWATSKPSSDPCDVTLTSTLYARDYLTGNSVLVSAGGTVVASISDIGSIAGATLIQTLGGAGGASGDVRIQVTTTKGQVYSFGVRLADAATLKHRVSWRLLNRD